MDVEPKRGPRREVLAYENNTYPLFGWLIEEGSGGNNKKRGEEQNLPLDGRGHVKNDWETRFGAAIPSRGARTDAGDRNSVKRALHGPDIYFKVTGVSTG